MNFLSPFKEKISKFSTIFTGQHGKSRQWLSFISIQFGRYSPNPAVTIAHFGFLSGGIFFETIRWISHDSMNAIALSFIKPVQAIVLHCFIEMPELNRFGFLKCCTFRFIDLYSDIVPIRVITISRKSFT